MIVSIWIIAMGCLHQLCTRLIGIVRIHHILYTTTISEILRVIFHDISVLLQTSIFIFFSLSLFVILSIFMRRNFGISQVKIIFEILSTIVKYFKIILTLLVFCSHTPIILLIAVRQCGRYPRVPRQSALVSVPLGYIQRESLAKAIYE